MDDQNHKTHPETISSHDDYLWDGSGAPDPEVQKLEVLLKEFRHDRPAPLFPAIVLEPRKKWFQFCIGWFPVFAGATAALLILSATILLLQSAHSNDEHSGW